MGNSLSIAHLSDLHLTATDGGRRKEDRAHGMNANLGRLLTHPSVQEADLVLITGDVSDRGEVAAWNVLWSSIRQAGLDLEKILVIHGNHDAACLGLRRARPTVEDLAIVRAGLEKGQQRTKLPYVRLFADGNIAVFALDSVNAGNFNLIDNAVGRIGFDQLAGLGRLLDEHAGVPCKLIALHHSPNIPASATSKRRGEKATPFWQRAALQLDRADRVALRLLARVFGVKAILHGHTHDNLDRRVNNVRVIGTRDSTVPNLSGLLSFKTYTFYPESGILKAQIRRVRAV
ncbi:MAG: metallophosphoesterase [Thermoanaerobaculales bacterium]|nr:metallophosphoesterase [Thermoanaerobaculales bacterium]